MFRRCWFLIKSWDGFFFSCCMPQWIWRPTRCSTTSGTTTWRTHEVNITTRSAAACATTWPSTSPVSLLPSRNMPASGISELRQLEDQTEWTIIKKKWSILTLFQRVCPSSFSERIISLITKLDLFYELRKGEGMTANMQSDLLKTWLAWQSKITFKGIVNIYFVFLELAADINIYHQWFTLLQNYHGPGIVLRYEVWWFISLVISIFN